MANLLNEGRNLVGDQWIPGQQQYFLEVPGAEKADGFSVVDWEIAERMGEPVEIRLEVTHPLRISRKHFLNRDATFVMSPVSESSRRCSGFIASFSTIKTTADFTKYRLVIKSHLARLQGIRQSRIFQHQTVPEILETMLRGHDIPAHLITFKLRRAHPQYAFKFQYQQDDFDFLHMLMQKEGIYAYTVESEHGDMLVLGDDVDHYLYEPQLNLPVRPMSGMNAAAESVFDLSIHSTTVPKSFVVAEYNENRSYERFRDEANIAPEDPTTYGTPYIYGTCHLDQQGAQWQAQLRHEAAIAWQVVFEGGSTKHALQVGRVFYTDEQLEDAPDGLLVVEITHRGGRDKNYTNTFKAIPADRRFRLKLKESKWPKIAGSLSARVTSPDRYKYAFLTAAGYYTVRFDLDFAEWPKGGESVPLRLAKPFAGALQTGMHFPALDNDEAIIQFRDQDPDKPYIAGFHHHSQSVDLVTSDRRWLSRNVIRTQSNNKLRMEDWAGQEGIKLSTEHSGKSQLNLGYLVDSNLEHRGSGYELRSDGHGALRSGSGMFISTDKQERASGKQLDMHEAMQRLDDAYARMEGLSQAAKVARAEAADLKAMSDVQQKQIKDLQEAVVLLSSSSSIALVSPDSIQHSAGANLIFTAGDSADVGVLRRFKVFAGEMISLFAHHMGMKLFANHGKIQIQAQNDEMELTSQQNMTVTSSEGHVVVQAGKSLTLTDGGGAYIKLENGQVTIGSPGQVAIKMASFKWDGPDNIQGKLPGFGVCHAAHAAAATSGENSGALA